MIRFSTVALLVLSHALQAQLPELIPYRKGDLWGYADSTGALKILPQWPSVWLFDSDGHASVTKKYALDKTDSSQYLQLIDKFGKPVVSHEFIMDFSHKHLGYRPYIQMTKMDSTIWVEMGEAGSLVFNLKGDFLCAMGEYYESFYSMLLNRQPESDGHSILRRRWRQFYFVDNSWNKLSRRYDEIHPDGDFNSYYLYSLKHYNNKGDSIIINPEGPAALVRRGRSWRVIDTNFRTIYKFKRNENDFEYHIAPHPKDQFGLYKKTVSPSQECLQMAIVFDSTGKCAYLNWSNQLVTPYIYDFPMNYWTYRRWGCNIPVTVVMKDSFMSFIDTSGKLLMPFQYREVSPFNGKYSVAFDSVWHWIDAHGNFVSPHSFRAIEPFNGEYGQGFDTAWHFIDAYGNILFEKYYRKGYQVVSGTRLCLLYNPKKKTYRDKYGREYFEE